MNDELNGDGMDLRYDVFWCSVREQGKLAGTTGRCRKEHACIVYGATV